MGKLIVIDDFDNFSLVKSVPPSTITVELVKAVQSLDERKEMEPFIRSIIFDTNDTPHGPAEIEDIITHKISVGSESGLAAFILKGKSFKTIRPHHVSHQIYRLEKIKGLKYAIFAASGTILDMAKEQFCSTCERMDFKYAIFDANDIARLFVAYGFLCPRDARMITTGRCKCGYSPEKRILNIFQRDSLKALEEARNQNVKSGLIVLPPGSGKTRISAEDALRQNAKSILYVAHTHEILDIAISEFEALFGKEFVSKHEDSLSFSKLNKVNIASIQLIHKHISIIPDKFDYLIIDEFHHAAAKSYRSLINKLNYDFLLGLTATPFRGDRQDISELCNGNILVNFELRSGIDSGILCPYHYFGCFDDIDYSKIALNGTWYNIKDLERLLIIPERDSAIINKWLELAEDKPTIAFCCSQKHAKRVAESFREKGIKAEEYLGYTTQDDRRELVDKLKSGDIKILCTVDVMNEGADFPFIECLLFLRPTESQRVFYQQLGRGLRRYPGKPHCIVIDFIANFQNAYKIVEYQGLMPDEELFGLGEFNDEKEVLNLPLGCKVNFDDRVIDIFAQQTLNPRFANRHNIGIILIYQYMKLANKLGHLPSKKEVDINLYIHSGFYTEVFGSWSKFLKVIKG